MAYIAYPNVDTISYQGFGGFMKKDPVLVGAIAVVSAMILSAIKPVLPQLYYGVLITLILYGLKKLVDHLRSNGHL